MWDFVLSFQWLWNNLRRQVNLINSILQLGFKIALLCNNEKQTEAQKQKSNLFYHSSR